MAADTYMRERGVYNMLVTYGYTEDKGLIVAHVVGIKTDW